MEIRETKLWRSREKANEENEDLLVQISVMKNELKALENKNDTLQTELETKRIDLKRLKAKEHYNERELRNLKRDLKRKDQNLEEAEESLDNALMEKNYYLESRFKDSQASNEQLNARIDELKEMVKELKRGRDYEHLHEEVELLKGSLDLCNHREKLLTFQVNALEAEASHFKNCELDFNRIMSEKDKKFKELKKESSRDIIQLRHQLATVMYENARILSENYEQDKKSRVIEELETTPTFLAKKEQILKQFFLGLSESLTFLLNKADSCSDAGNKTQVYCEKYFAM
ncbi:hypothetical protein OS493_023859 [Desmophyllum pertusum]|uniref:Uncharacterized protein n=1 Tax=Desmophyllum pertusum TaxID=174260 RepID=A0A9X0CJV3_9CNID|nr:hypothetical protein OS493_023859 [Desmophyllum pertusum]